MDRQDIAQLTVLALLCFFGPGAQVAGAAAAKDTTPAQPSFPAVVSLTLQPAALVLEDGRDERRVLVWAKEATGESFDVTSEASFRTESAAVEVEHGVIRPKSKGKPKSLCGLPARKRACLSRCERRRLRRCGLCGTSCPS